MQYKLRDYWVVWLLKLLSWWLHNCRGDTCVWENRGGDMGDQGTRKKRVTSLLFRITVGLVSSFTNMDLIASPITTYFLFLVKSNLAQPETSRTVILPLQWLIPDLVTLVPYLELICTLDTDTAFLFLNKNKSQRCWPTHLGTIGRHRSHLSSIKMIKDCALDRFKYF